MTWKEIKDKLENELNVKDSDKINYIDFHSCDIETLVVSGNEEDGLEIWA